MKLYRNETTTDCTPTAVLNILKLEGFSIKRNSEEFAKIKEELGYTPRVGTFSKTVEKMFRARGFKVTVRKNITVKTISKYLAKGKKIILSYYDTSPGDAGHDVVIVGETKNFFITVNEMGTSNLVSRKSKKYYIKCFKMKVNSTFYDYEDVNRFAIII